MPEKITLRSLREAMGLTVEDVASQMEKRARTIYNWEAGLTPPTLTPKETQLLCWTYSCTLQQLALAVENTKQMNQA